MKKHGILNSEISKVLSDLGHTDQITIADCGLPTPEGVSKIDLAIQFGLPSFMDVFKAVLADMKVEKIILANEIQEINPYLLKQIKNELPDIDIEFITHEQFKALTKNSKTIIRSGECTPYANCILQSGVIF